MRAAVEVVAVSVGQILTPRKLTAPHAAPPRWRPGGRGHDGVGGPGTAPGAAAAAGSCSSCGAASAGLQVSLPHRQSGPAQPAGRLRGGSQGGQTPLELALVQGKAAGHAGRGSGVQPAQQGVGVGRTQSASRPRRVSASGQCRGPARAASSQTEGYTNAPHTPVSTAFWRRHAVLCVNSWASMLCGSRRPVGVRKYGACSVPATMGL